MAELTDEILAVYAHYRGYHLRCAPTLRSNSLEYQRIKDRLKEGYTVEDLKTAVDGCHVSEFHNGDNEKGQSYHALTLIFRSASHVQRFLETWDAWHVKVERNEARQRAAMAARRETDSDPDDRMTPVQIQAAVKMFKEGGGRNADARR